MNSPGAMQFTRTSGASAMARQVVKCTIAALETQ